MSILSINEEPITEQTNVDYLINNLPIGQLVPMIIMHQNKAISVEVMVGSKTNDDAQEIAYSKITPLGIGVSDMTDELKMNFNVPHGMNGVLVAHLDVDMPLSVGDVILKVGQKEIKNADELKSAIETQASENSTKIALFIYCPQEAHSERRKGEYRYVSIPIQKNPNSVLNKLPKKVPAKVIPVSPAQVQGQITEQAQQKSEPGFFMKMVVKIKSIICSLLNR